MMRKSFGFTLIELLIVMAILGVLAVVVLVAINPVQQLARTRDAGRKSAVSQLGRALEAFYTSHGGKYLYGNATGTNCDTQSPANVVFGSSDAWETCLKNAGEISTEPALIAHPLLPGDCALSAGGYSTVQNGICYTTDSIGSQAIIYTRLESSSEASKCAAGVVPYFVWSTKDGRGGLVCFSATNPPGPGNQTWNTMQ